MITLRRSSFGVVTVWVGVAVGCASPDWEGDEVDLQMILPVASQAVTGEDSEQQVVNDLVDPSAVVDTRTIDGQIVDCVDATRQPALFDPATRTYRPLLAPPSPEHPPLEMAENEQVAQPRSTSCPSGSVPILRVTQDQLGRFAGKREFFSKYPSSGDPAVDPGHPFPGQLAGPSVNGLLFHFGPTTLHQYATAKKLIANWGAKALINVWKPSVELSTEFSLMQIWVAGGSGNGLQTVEAGVQVYRLLYGDDQPHLFIYSTRDGYNNTGCYNNSCGDFVQVSSSLYPGAKYSDNEVSVPGGVQKTNTMVWYKDGEKGSWWLRIDGNWIGYYNRTLFNMAGIEFGASRFDFGGEIINATSGRHTKTDMGSGAFPSAGFGYAAYMRLLEYYYSSTGGTNGLIGASGMSTYRDDALCYDIDYFYSNNFFWYNSAFLGGGGYGLSCM